MKKLSLVLSIVLVMSVIFLTACGTDSTTTVATTAGTTASTTAGTTGGTTAGTTAVTTAPTTAAPTTTASDAIKIGSQADLEGKIIAVQLGTIGDEIASDEIKAKSVERFTAYVDAVSSLKQKKVDCMIMDADTAAAYADQNTDLMVLDVGFEPEEYAMGVAKTGSEDLLKSINEVIAELKASDSIVKFKESHVGQNGKAPDFNVGASGGNLVIGTEPTFPPYEYTQGNDIIGVDIDIMAAVAKKLNMELVVENMSFEGLIPAVKSGKIKVIAAGMSVSEDRKVNVSFSDPYTDAKQVVLMRKSSQK